MEKASLETKESSTFSNKIDSKKQEKKWVVILVAIISLARISHGLFISITGPTLLFLAENVNSDVTQVSAIFSGRSAGILVGAAVFSGVMYRYKDFNPFLSLGLGLGVNGIVMLVTPFLSNLWGLVIATTIGGIMFGYLDAGMQAVYLRLWGEEKSRPYIQSFHFGFSVGAALAPLIAKPFLEAASLVDSGSNCPSQGNPFETTAAYTTLRPNVTATTPQDDYFNPVNWCFIIIGAYTIIISIVMSVLAIMKIDRKVESHNVETTESRPEEPIKDVWVFFIPLCFYYFCCVSSEIVYQGYIYVVAICSDLEFDVTQASWLSFTFWAGFMIGRGSGIFFSNYFKPSTIIVCDLVGTTTALTVMSIWGEYIPLIAWLVTFFHGLCVATLYSTGVSWTSQVTNMAGTYIFVYNIGNAIGAMTMMPAGGALFEREPFSVIYLINGTCAANIVFFVLMVIIGRKRKIQPCIVDEDSSEKNGEYNDGFESEKSKNVSTGF